MKKRILTFAFILVCLFSTIILSSCVLDFLCKHEGYHSDPVVENHKPSYGDSEGSYDEVVYCTRCDKEVSRTAKTYESFGVFAEGLGINGAVISGVVANEVSAIDLTASIGNTKNAEWYISSDSEGQSVLDKANLALTEGMNTVYLHIPVENVGKITYTVEIYRKKMVTVSFNANGGFGENNAEFFTVTVEEGSLVESIPVIFYGNVFKGWMLADATGAITEVAFDFASPVNENTSLIAKWETDAEANYYIQYYFQDTSLKSYTVDTSKTYEGVGITGTYADIVTPDFEGFVLKALPESRRIIADGSLVIDVYYDVDLDTRLVTSEKFTLEGDTFRFTTANSSTSMIVSGYFKVLDGATWNVTSGTPDGSVVTNKAVALKLGSNYFYLNVTAPESAVRTYAIEVYRNHKYTVTFSAVGDVPTNFSGITRNVEEGNTTTEPYSQYVGYIFKGWEKVVTSDSGTTYVPFDFSTPITENMTIVGRWEEDTNIKYVIEYHFQNLKKNGYEINEEMTVIGGGRANTYVECPIPEIQGFTVKTAPAGGNIAINGSLVLRVYYDRNTYTVTSVSENTSYGSVTRGGDYAYGTSLSLTARAVAGYAFAGWYSGDTLVSTKSTIAFEVTGNISLTAKWKVRTDIPYKVSYYMQNLSGSGYYVGESYTFYGTLGETVEAEVKTFEGFKRRDDSLSTSATVKGDGTTEIKIYYNRISYTIESMYAGKKNYLYGTSVTLSATQMQGYTFDGWFKDGVLVTTELVYTFEVTENAKFTYKYTAHTGIKYTVEYYLQTYSGTFESFKLGFGYSPTYTREFTGYTGEFVKFSSTASDATHTPESFEGYYFTGTNSVISGNVKYDGSLVLKLYYNLSTPYVEAKSEKDVAGTVTSPSKSLPYGIEVTLSATANPGYSFAGWYLNNELVSEETTYSFVVDSQKRFVAKWNCIEAEYTVIYYKQTSLSGVTGPGEKFTFTATTEQTVTAPLYDVYEQEGLSILAEASTLSGVVKGDGSLTLKVLYVNPICCSYETSDRELVIFFGEYPQTIKADNVTITDVVDDRGYYLGDDGAYYAKVVAQPYSNDYFKFTNGQKIMTGEVYYFKVEPIRWRLFQIYVDGMTYYDSIICDVIIDAQMFNSSGGCQYPDSDIRNWLNDEFYNVAFDSSIRGRMKATYVMNTLTTMYPFYRPESPGATLSSEYVFLASYSELTSKNNGFMADSEYDPSRQRIATDYARARGIFVDEYGYGRWYQRTPASYYANYKIDGVVAVDKNGNATSTANASQNEGVVPVITIYKWTN